MFNPFEVKNAPRNGNFANLFGRPANGNRNGAAGHSLLNNKRGNNGVANLRRENSGANRINSVGSSLKSTELQGVVNGAGNGLNRLNMGANAGMGMNGMNQMPANSASGSPVVQSTAEEILPMPMGMEMGMGEGMGEGMGPENTTIYGDKHHFYIGTMIHRDYTNELAKIQKQVKSPEFQNPRWNIFHLRHIYLGYLDTRVAKEMMKKIFLPLCLAIGQSIGPIECDYTKLLYRSKPPKNTGPKIISLGFKDKDSVLQKKIIPYLKKEGLRKIYNVDSKPETPAVDLLYLNSPDDIYRQMAEMMRKSIRIPTRGFEINHLCLIKETPYARRGGIPSRYDRMNVESVKGYYYPLKGNKEEFNREYTRINQMRLENEANNQQMGP